MLLRESGCLLLRFDQVPVDAGGRVQRVDATGSFLVAGSFGGLMESGDDVHGYSSLLGLFIGFHYLLSLLSEGIVISAL